MDELLTSRFEALLVAFAERVEHVLTVKKPLRFDLSAVKEFLDRLGRGGPERAGPLQEPLPRSQPVNATVLDR